MGHDLRTTGKTLEAQVEVFAFCAVDADGAGYVLSAVIAVVLNPFPVTWGSTEKKQAGKM